MLYFIEENREAPIRGFFRDSQLFVARGNVLDLAVAVVIGAAFGGVTTSLVDDVLTPLGLLIGEVDLQALTLRLNDSVVIRYGAFLNTVIQFLIIAFVVFLLVKLVNSLRRKEAESPETPPAPTPSEALLSEIRDLLAGRAAGPRV